MQRTSRYPQLRIRLSQVSERDTTEAEVIDLRALRGRSRRSLRFKGFAPGSLTGDQTKLPFFRITNQVRHLNAGVHYNRNSMNLARIAKLLEPFLEGQMFSPAQLSCISTYIDILLRWNARINLTAIRDPEQIVTRHFGESLFAARHLFRRAGAQSPEVPPCSSAPSVVKSQKVADVGSGPGFPGLPIKLWAPHISLTLIESSHKKATFLREVVRALTLTDVNIQNVRAESLPPRAYDLVTLRAVERFETILPVAASLVADDGRLALLLGSAQVPKLRTALPLYSLAQPLSIPSSSTRILVIAQKTATQIIKSGNQ